MEPNLAAFVAAVELPVHSTDVESVDLVLYHAHRRAVQFQWLVAVVVASVAPVVHRMEAER